MSKNILSFFSVLQISFFKVLRCVLQKATTTELNKHARKNLSHNKDIPFISSTINK